MSHQRLLLAAAILLITTLGYVLFPGHTWLQQDTQIYVPIFEHLENPSVLAHDPVATHPHVAFTIYDELVLTARRLTGASIHTIMTADQLVFRLFGILGVFLIATSMGLSRRLALLVAAIYALGATVLGPAVLTVEYEPKPRGAALGMILFAVGLIAHGRYLPASLMASLAVLYHPPTVAPFWAVYAVMAVWPASPEERKRRLAGLAVFAASCVTLLAAAHFQAGGPENQAWFARIPPGVEKIMKFRASYAWVSLWPAGWWWQYLALVAASVLALVRLWPSVNARLRFFVIGLPVAGLLGVGASYLFLDVGKWALAAKFQPARAVLFVTLVTVILAAAACLRAGAARRIPEALGWGGVAFAIAIQQRFYRLLLPDLSNPLVRRRLLLLIVLAALATGTAVIARRRPRLAWVSWSLAVLAPFLLIPSFGRVVTERNMHYPELAQLSAWARTSTPPGAVFLFPDVGKGRQPGIFRATAERAIYVDWKSGGQANMVAGFARDWWRRYRTTMLRPFQPSDLDRYSALGIDYVVLQPENPRPLRRPVYENRRYLVYRTGPVPGERNAASVHGSR